MFISFLGISNIFYILTKRRFFFWRLSRTLGGLQIIEELERKKKKKRKDDETHRLKQFQLKSLMHTQTGLSTLKLSLWVFQFLAHSKPIRHQDNRHQRKFLIRRVNVFQRVLKGTSYALWKKERWKEGEGELGCVWLRGVSVWSHWKFFEKKMAAMIGLTYGKRLSIEQH